MNFILAHITIRETANIVFLVALLFLVYKYLETFWSYKISKPYAWETAVSKKMISKKLIKIERTYRDKVRLYNLWFQVEQLKKNSVSGAFAELGVHKGETARAIHHMDEDRTFYLFDTFEGFKKKTWRLKSRLTIGLRQKHLLTRALKPCCATWMEMTISASGQDFFLKHQQGWNQKHLHLFISMQIYMRPL